MPTEEVIEQIEEELPEEGEEVIEGDEPSEEGEEAGEEGEEGEEELDEASQVEAKALYKLLKNPATRSKVIRELASVEGLTGRNAPETPAETKRAKKEIKEILTERLGDEFKFLIPKLGEAIEDILAQEREDYEEKQQSTQKAVLTTQVESALARLSKETDGASKKLEAKIAELTSKYPKPEDSSIFEYLKEMYVLAGGSVKKGNNTREIIDRVQRAAKNAPGRLQSTGSGTGGGRREPAPNVKLKGLANIVKAQAEKMSKG